MARRSRKEVLNTLSNLSNEHMDFVLQDVKKGDGLDEFQSGELHTKPKNPNRPTSWELASMHLDEELERIDINAVRSQKEKLLARGSDPLNNGSKYYNYSFKRMIINDKNGENIIADMKDVEKIKASEGRQKKHVGTVVSNTVENAEVYDDLEDYEWCE
jgi:tRNA splicing endonuclease